MKPCLRGSLWTELGRNEEAWPGGTALPQIVLSSGRTAKLRFL